MTAATVTTWTGCNRYRVTSHGAGKSADFWHVRAETEDGRQRLTFLISREAFARLPPLFEIGHVLAEGGTIL